MLQQKRIRNVGKKRTFDSNAVLDKFLKPKIEESRNRAELKIAAFISEHCSILAVDHLCEVVSDLNINSEGLKNIKLDILQTLRV